MKILDIIHTAIVHPNHIPSFYNKIIHAFDYFDIDYRFLRGYSFPPKSVCLILSEKCNLRCRMCDIGQANVHPSADTFSPLVNAMTKGEERMTLQDWLMLVEDLSKFSPRPLVLLTGTEPLLYPDVFTVIEAIAAKKIPLHITTNGTLLSRYAGKIVALSQSPYDVDITVSIDDIGEAHDNIRGVRGTFQKAIDGIVQVVKAREEMKKDFPSINITCTVSNYNYKKLESFVEWFVQKKLPIESITFNHLWFKDTSIVESHNRKYGKTLPVTKENMADIDISAIDMESVNRQLLNLANKRPRVPFRVHQQPDLSLEEARVYYKVPCRFIFYNRCTAPWRNVAVTPKGNIILSPMCFFPSVGNVKKEPLAVSWNGKAFRKLRSQLKNLKPYPACSRCCMLFGSKPKYAKMKGWFA